MLAPKHSFFVLNHSLFLNTTVRRYCHLFYWRGVARSTESQTGFTRGCAMTAASDLSKLFSPKFRNPFKNSFLCLRCNAI